MYAKENLTCVCQKEICRVCREMSDQQYVIKHKENITYKKVCHHVMCAEKCVIGGFHHEGKVLVISPLVVMFHV